MHDEPDSHHAIPQLLSTQLLTAEVYATFLQLSSIAERKLWEKMLADELEHVDCLKTLLLPDVPAELEFPYINVSRMREVCDRVSCNAGASFLLRLEGALRLECAELDYGLEGLAAKRLAKCDLTPHYPMDVNAHVSDLLAEATRYAMSPNIGMQVTRLTDILSTSLSEKETRTLGETTRFITKP